MLELTDLRVSPRWTVSRQIIWSAMANYDNFQKVPTFRI
jgi:hypothetical protein